MNTTITLPITEARKKIFDIAEAVQKPGISYTFTENGRPKAVLMSAEEFESWQETIEVMRDFPDLDKDIARANRDVRSGAYKKYSTLDQVLEKFGYVVADKGNKQYAISSTVGAKGRKTARKNTGKRAA